MRDVRKFGLRVDSFSKSRSYTETMSSRFLLSAFSVIAAVISLFHLTAFAQQTHTQPGDGVTIQGNVLSSAGKSVSDASVWLEQEGTLKRVETKTDAAGAFAFATLAPGRYLL